MNAGYCTPGTGTRGLHLTKKMPSCESDNEETRPLELRGLAGSFCKASPILPKEKVLSKTEAPPPALRLLILLVQFAILKIAIWVFLAAHKVKCLCLTSCGCWEQCWVFYTDHLSRFSVCVCVVSFTFKNNNLGTLSLG